MFEICFLLLGIGIGGGCGLLVLRLERLSPEIGIESIRHRMGVDD